MPSLAVPVSLSEVIEVQGDPLREDQVWGVLCQAAEALQDLFIKGEAIRDNAPVFVLSPESLLLCKTGRVQFGVSGKLSAEHIFRPPETSHRLSISDTGIEKMYVYSLGQTLIWASGCKTNKQRWPLSSSLSSLLSAICVEDPSRRMALVYVLEACTLHSAKQPGHLTNSGHVIQLYNSILGDPEEVENFHPNMESRNQPRESRMSRHRPKFRTRHHGNNSTLHQPAHQENSWSPSLSPSRSRSRSRSNSRGRPDYDRKRRGRPRRPLNGNSSYPRVHNPRNGTLHYDGDSSSSYGSQYPRDRKHHSENGLKPFRNHAGFTPSFMGQVTTSAFNAPKQDNDNHENSAPLTSPAVGEAAYQKYLKLKERQQRLKALRADLEGDKMLEEPPLVTIPRQRDGSSETRSMASAASYAAGTYFPDLHATYGSELALQLIKGRDRDSVISSEISTSSQDPPILRNSKENLNPEPTEDSIVKTVAALPIHRSVSPSSTQRQSITSAVGSTAPREFYGPEFVFRSSQPVAMMSFPLIGESLKNPSCARPLTVVLLTGQRLGVLCDPSTTSQLLFDSIVSHCSLPEQQLFGLTYINDGEHLFMENDTKLHKVAPEGWKGDAKHQQRNVIFTVYLRIKFYPHTLAIVKSPTTRHMLYLQLRRDLLEERLQCPEEMASHLAAIALQAEYDDYDRSSMGRTYFNPEYYLCAHVIRRVGTGYIRDHLPEKHGTKHGMPKTQAELEFIKMAQKLPEYGIHFYKLFKDKADTSSVAWVGIGCKVLTVAEARGDQRVIVQQYQWSRTHKVSFNKRRFSAQPKPEPGQQKPPKLNFYTNSYRKGRYLLQFVTAQHRYQMTLGRPGAIRQVHQDADNDIGLPLEGDSVNYDDVEAEIQPVNQPERELTPPLDHLENQQNETVELAVANRSAGTPSVPPVVYRNPPMYNYRRAPRLGVSSMSPPGAHIRMAPPSNIQAATPPVPEATPPFPEAIPSVPEATPTVPEATPQGPLTGLLLAQTNPISSMNNVNVVNDTSPKEYISSPADEISYETPYTSPAVQVLGASIHSSDPTIIPPPIFSESLSETLENRFNALPSPESFDRYVFEVTLERDITHDFGITIVGGENTGRLDLGIFIQSVTTGSPADRDGRIHPGDRLIAINDHSLEGMQHHVAVQLIRNSQDSVKLFVSQVKSPDSSHNFSAQNSPRRDTQNSNRSDQRVTSPPIYDADAIVDNLDNPNSSNHLQDTSVEASSLVSPNSPLEPDVEHEETHPKKKIDEFSSSPDRNEHVVNSANHEHTPRQTLDYLEENQLPADYSSDFFQTDNSFLYENGMSQFSFSQSPGFHTPTIYNHQSNDISTHLHPNLISQKSLEAELHFLGIDPDVDELVESSTDSDFDEVLDAALSLKESPRNVFGGEFSEVAVPSESLEENMMEVKLVKKENTLGLSIGPGEISDQGDMGLFVTEVDPDGPAAESGKVNKGDRVCSINGMELSKLSSQEIVQLLSSLPDECVFVFKKQEGFVETTSVGVQAVPEQPPSKLGEVEFEGESSIYTPLYPGFGNLFTIELEKGSSGLGFSIHVTDMTDQSTGVIRIKKIFPAGAAGASGRLLEGDIILQVNDHSLLGRSQTEAVSVLRQAESPVLLILSRSDSSNIPANISKASDETLNISSISEITPPSEVAIDTNSALSLTLVSQVIPDDEITPAPDGTSTPRISRDSKTPPLFPHTDIQPLSGPSSNGVKITSMNSMKIHQPQDKDASDAGMDQGLTNIKNNTSCKKDSASNPHVSSTDTPVENGVSLSDSHPDENDEVSTDVWAGDDDSPEVSRSETDQHNTPMSILTSNTDIPVEFTRGDNPDDWDRTDDTLSVSSDSSSAITFRPKFIEVPESGVNGQRGLVEASEGGSHLCENDVNNKMKVTADNDTEDQVIEVTLSKELSGGLGFTLAGGVHTTGLCYIKGIAQDPALSDGRLQPGDKLIQVNGQDMSQMTHFEAVTLLREAPTIVHIVVRRDKGDHSKSNPQISVSETNVDAAMPALNESASESDHSETLADTPENSVTNIIQNFQSSNLLIKPKDYKVKSPDQNVSDEQVSCESTDSTASMSNHQGSNVVHVKIAKAESGGLGFSLVTVETGNYTSVYIKSITAGSVSEGKLCAGDKLLQVNGESVVGMNQSKVAAILKKAPPGVLDMSVSRTCRNKSPKSNKIPVTPSLSNPLAQDAPPKPPRRKTPVNTIVKSAPDSTPDKLSLWNNDLSELWVDGMTLVTPMSEGLYEGEGLEIIIEELEQKLELDEVLHEYKELKHVKSTDDCSVARQPQNKPKNRYRNVLPYDCNRVKLDDNEDFYINASDIYVTVGQKELHYIASQGPLPNTTDDFWEMVWQHDVHVIAMVTLDMEADKVKCHKYWPETIEDDILINDRYQLRLHSEQRLCDFVVRKLVLDDLVSRETRHVYHLNYTSWPDHGVPECATPLLKFMRVVEYLSDEHPILVHCSAGIGRTGALLTTHITLTHIEQDLQFSIYDVVSDLRRQRQGMIQTKDQYAFCFQAVLESLQTLR